jgi:hypothetical protein
MTTFSDSDGKPGDLVDRPDRVQFEGHVGAADQPCGDPALPQLIGGRKACAIRTWPR